MFALIVAFSLGGSIGFLAGCCFRSWLDAQSPTTQHARLATGTRESV